MAGTAVPSVAPSAQSPPAVTVQTHSGCLWPLADCDYLLSRARSVIGGVWQGGPDSDSQESELQEWYLGSRWIE
eukprot:901650-Rhodomonas_salina.1